MQHFVPQLDIHNDTHPMLFAFYLWAHWVTVLCHGAASRPSVIDFTDTTSLMKLTSDKLGKDRTYSCRQCNDTFVIKVTLTRPIWSPV